MRVFLSQWRVAIVVFLLLAHSAANATLFDPTGTWSGTLNEQEFNCTPGFVPESDTFNASIDVTGFDPATGEITVTWTDPEFSFTITGGTTTDKFGFGYKDIITTGSETLPDGSLDEWTDYDTGVAIFTVSGTDSVSVSIQGDFYTEGTVTSAAGVIPYTGSCEYTITGTMTRAITPTAITGTVAPEEAPGSTIVSNSVEMLDTKVKATYAQINTRIQSAIKGSVKTGMIKKITKNGVVVEAPIGQAAGDGWNTLGAWGSYSHSSFDNDFFRTKYDGDQDTFLGGIDFSPRKDMIVGVALGFEKTDVDTDFNNGESNTSGYTIAPYFGMVFNDTWNMDASFGYSELETDQYRIDPGLGTRFDSDVDTERWFIGANINGFTQVDNWLFSGRAGLMHAESKDGSFIDTDVPNGGTTSIRVEKRSAHLTQMQIGGEIAYSADQWEPYALLSYNYDISSTRTKLAATATTNAQPDRDHADANIGAGFRFYGKEGLTLGFEWNTRLGREDFNEDTFNLNARWDF